MIERLDEYRIPLRPVQYLDDPEAYSLTMIMIEIAVAKGIVRWVERQPAPGWWHRQIIETYPAIHEIRSECQAWQGTKALLSANMQSDRWLEGQKDYQCLWDYSADLAGEYFMRGGLWYWEMSRD